MSIQYILILSLVAFLAGWIIPRQKLVSALLVISLLALFWLQPSTSIRNLDFWLPLVSLALTVLTWAIISPLEGRSLRRILPVILGILLLPLIIAANRYLDPYCCLTPSRPPQFLPVLAASVGIAGLFLAVYLLRPQRRVLSWLGIVLLLAVFIVLKSQTLAQLASGWLRGLTGQPVDLASASDLTWLGFSFLAFRLLHVLRDSQAESQVRRLPAGSLSEFTTYALFFPAVVSGPIDRLQHFSAELARLPARPFWSRRARPDSASISEPSQPWFEDIVRDDINGLWRILNGCFKKFVLADGLALFALNAQNASQTHTTAWMWVLLLAYTLRIYFDFAGYTDVAIGIARLVGINLPENFNRPYLKQNLTAFWNSWHITLSQWFRSYIFFPLTRALRTRAGSTPVWLTILAGQLVTMGLIGLWHGISWNFLIWGLWHGLGLFIQNRWSDWLKGRLDLSSLSRPVSLLLQFGGWLLTFIYISLGWVWFALPTPLQAIQVFRILL